MGSGIHLEINSAKSKFDLLPNIIQLLRCDPHGGGSLVDLERSRDRRPAIRWSVASPRARARIRGSTRFRLERSDSWSDDSQAWPPSFG